jgi:hypothetical protein
MFLEYLALSVLSAAPDPCVVPRLSALAAARQDPAQDHQAEYEKRLKEAEGSVEKLWALYEWCQSNALDKQGRAVLRAILKVDDNDKKAHELLGEVSFDGKWFANDKKVEEYKKKQLEAEAKKTGKAIYNGELVDPADLPNLEKGLKKLDGKWVSAEDYQHISEGWTRQDLEWVAPADKPNVEKGLWKCGDKWLSEADANKYHSELGKWWRIPTDHFWLYSTCTREIAKKASLECEHSFSDLMRMFGKAPGGPVTVLVLNSREQYNDVSMGKLGAAVELRGFSSLHGAYLAEIWQEPFKNGQASGAIAYWDEKAGALFVRHAAGQAFVEALDPSPKTMKDLMSGDDPTKLADDFWKEKLVPEWYRYGAANFVEQYLMFSGDALRKWSIGRIAAQGGLDPIEKFLKFELSLDDPAKSDKLILESGLVMAFVLDGKCAPVTEKLAAFKLALNTGKDVKKAGEALEDAVKKNEAALRKFAGI